MNDYIVYHTNKKGLTGLVVMNKKDKQFLSINTDIIEPVLAHSDTLAITKTKTYKVLKNGILIST